jgi:DNA-binding NarL/FixJ family response regulator
MNLPVAVVFLTMYNELDVFDAAIKLGVKGYILKENAAEDIIVALDKVVHGGHFISPSMYEKSQQRSDRVQPLPLSKPQLDQLTPAEKHILKLIAEDRTSKEIADLLQISFRTVEKHRLNICNKLKLHGSHSLLKFAFDHKMHL